MRRVSSEGVKPALGLQTSKSFDYSETPPDVTNFLKGQADRIRRYAGKCIITIGKDLIGAKRYLPHGAFVRWVESEVGIPARSAQGYMKVAEWVADKSTRAAQLPPSVLYVLSRPRTPKAFADAILERVEAGEHVALPVIRDELRLLLATKEDALSNANAEWPAQEPIEPEIIAPDTSVRAALIDAITIMARGLRGEDFARVRKIMTDGRLLSTPDLAEHIAAAFGTAETSQRPRFKVGDLQDGSVYLHVSG